MSLEDEGKYTCEINLFNARLLVNRTIEFRVIGKLL